VGSRGEYWASSSGSQNHASTMIATSSSASQNSQWKNDGRSVRCTRNY
jgi:hypothetical protein